VDKTALPQHLPVADGLRGLAVLATMIFHIQFFTLVAGAPLWERAYAMVAGLGWAGVDLFFVLSGFLITRILYDTRTQPNYYRVFYLRRLVRIFPLYYAALLVLLVLVPALMQIGGAAPSGTTFASPTTQLLAWLYLVNWDLAMQGFGYVTPLIAHFWSLSVEEQFYLAWPAVIRTLSRRGLMALCVAMVVAAALTRVALFSKGWPAAAYVLPFARMGGLAIGAFIALAGRSASDWARLGKWVRRAMPVVVALFVLLVARAGTTDFGDPLIGTVGISLLSLFFGCALVMLIDGKEEGRAQRLAGSPALRWFGKYSYCLYVVNQPTMVILAKLGITVAGLQALLHSRALALLGVNAVGIGLCVLIAFASWHLFEKHWLALKRRPQLNHPGLIKEAVPT
jgi:peptidoglycan/LPS O-acetylase OafA/YrhL